MLRCKNCSGRGWRAWQRVPKVLTWLSNFSDLSLTEYVAVGYDGQTSLVQGGSTSWLTGFKAAKSLVSDTIAHLQRSCWAHALMGHSCLVVQNYWHKIGFRNPHFFTALTFLYSLYTLIQISRQTFRGGSKIHKFMQILGQELQIMFTSNIGMCSQWLGWFEYFRIIWDFHAQQSGEFTQNEEKNKQIK